MRYFQTLNLIFILAAGPAGAATLTIDSTQFKPTQIQLNHGETLKVINLDLVPHTVTSTHKKFDSGIILPQKKWNLRLTKPGKYPFHCNLHPTMVGEIIVR